jgi:uncharacterized protein YbjT (DUF2867 family)
MRILVTGATGTVASTLIPSLLQAGHPVRAMAHSNAKVRRLAAICPDVVVGDFADSASLDRAFAGTAAVLIVTPPHARAAEWASAALDAAKRARVRRVVRISAIKASSDGPNDNSRQHARTDEEIRQSGMDFVILRPHFFMQNCLFGTAESVASSGVVRFAGGDARLGMIDPRDIADVAARALVDSRWDGGTYDLTGPACISFHDVAQTLSRMLNRKVRYEPISPEAAADFVRRAGGSEWQAEATRGYFRAYAAGWGDFTTDWVQQISKQSARSFEQFADEIAAPLLRPLIESAGPGRDAQHHESRDQRQGHAVQTILHGHQHSEDSQ